MKLLPVKVFCIIHILSYEVSERYNTVSKSPKLSQKVDENALENMSMHNMLEHLSKEHVLKMDSLVKKADDRDPEMLASVGVPPIRIMDYRESTEKNK